jgi:hypothetical protein
MDGSTYRTVPRGDFAAMLDADRYATRSAAFDQLIAGTHSHFWDPDDPTYIRFDDPLPVGAAIIPASMVPELRTTVADRLDAEQQVAFANETACWYLSNLLHGEQGAFSLSTSLCDMFWDAGSQEYAANQAREEARHVRALSRYIGTRYGGRTYPPTETIRTLLTQLVHTDTLSRKLVGMQMIVEGVALGALSVLHVKSQDPVLRRLCQLILADEVFHHKFGRAWALTVLPTLAETERHAVEDWALGVFNALVANLFSSAHKSALYERFGLDPVWVRAAVHEAYDEASRRRRMNEVTSIFRAVVKTLLTAGVITARTRAEYARWIDMADLVGDGDLGPAREAADGAMEFLRAVNEGAAGMARRLSARRQ